MGLPLLPEDLKKMKMFIDLCSTNLQILNLPQLDFFKAFVEKLGGKVPAGEFKLPDSCPFGGDARRSEIPKQNEPGLDNLEEMELNLKGSIEPDNDPIQPMGDITKTPTEEEIEQSNELRGQAAAAFSEKEYQEAIDLYTKAIELNPGNALFHAKRGQAFLKLDKPNACIRDCDRALELNCDSAAAYKFRGRAHQLLGHWESAAKDLRQACKLDYDEDADEWLREVTPNAKLIEQRRIEKEREQAEKEQKERRQRPSTAPEDITPFDISDIFKIMNKPELRAAVSEIIENPESISKYKNNPEITKILSVVEKFPASIRQNLVNLASGAGFPGAGAGCFPNAGAAGFPGAAAAGFPGAEASGFPGGGAGATGFPGSPPASAPNTEGVKVPPKNPDFVDDGLD